MKKKTYTFKVGDRVALAVSTVYDEREDDDKIVPYRYDPDENPEYGKVTDVLSSGKLVVQWDNEWYQKYNTDPVSAADLLPEEEFKKLHAKLEKEFEDTEKLIKEKLKEAGKIVREANKLAKKTGRELHDMYEATSPLVNAMDASGWNSSSWGC